MRRPDGGFTLFEVLGAVAILAIVYTTLSGVAIHWLRAEGESRRILEASLIADWEVSEFELELDTGVAPEIGIIQSEDDDGLTLTWEVTPLQTKIFKTALEKEQERAAANPDIPIPPVPVAQAAATDAIAPPFLQVELRISWLEAGNERIVKRTLFAVDEDAAAKLAAAAVPAQATPDGEPIEDEQP